MTALQALARPSGGLAMVALDQRESLRTIIAERTERPLDDVPDDELRACKVQVARTLSPHASALLLDTDFGVGPVLGSGALAARCSLILAADRLQQERGAAVQETDLDPEVDLDAIRRSGAAALKLLVLWRGPRRHERLTSIIERFLARCRAAGVASVLEGVVRPPDGDDPARHDREAAILEAATALSVHGPDLYKAEVPLRGRAEPDELRDRCAALDAAIGRPWVVLSQGVSIDHFPAAVEAACRAGASGFLAGRAIWTDSIRADGRLEDHLREIAVPRLRALASIVDRFARPVTAGSDS